MFTIRVNGDDLTVADSTPRSTLLEFLRSRGLPGSKEGCADPERVCFAVKRVRAAEAARA